jgi:Na+-transporting NADH:ubiquinone oxidoreductase subunit NqrA
MTILLGLISLLLTALREKTQQELFIYLAVEAESFISIKAILYAFRKRIENILL